MRSFSSLDNSEHQATKQPSSSTIALLYSIVNTSIPHETKLTVSPNSIIPHNHILTLVYIRGDDVKYSDAQKEATARYNKKAYDRINIIVKKGQRQIIKDFAASQGKSLNRFILDAVDAAMKQETE